MFRTLLIHQFTGICNLGMLIGTLKHIEIALHLELDEKTYMKMDGDSIKEYHRGNEMLEASISRRITTALDFARH